MSNTNEMVAHIWAQGRKERGASGNGNFFFEGPALYSYGRHFLVAFRAERDDAGALVLLNADSYSISTGRHQAYARAAVRHLESHTIPRLTDIAGALEMTTPAQRARRDDYGRTRQENARAGLLQHMAAHALGMTADARVALARLAGMSPARAVKAAAVAYDKARRAKAKAAADKARDAHEAAKAAARQWGDMTPDALRAAMRRDPDAQLWARRRNVVLLGAMQKARALGWTARAERIKAARRLIAVELENIGRMAESAAGRRNVRAHIAAAKAMRHQYRTTGRIQTTAAHIARTLGLAAVALEHARPAGLRAFGFDPAASAAAMRAAVPDVQRIARLSARADTRDRMRARIRALRDAMRPDADESALRAGWAAARAFRDESSRNHHDPAARLAGWTPEKVAESVKAFADMFDSRLETLEQERAAEWLAAVPGAPRPRRRDDGLARVRALGVERDDAGRITGGTLETDQGAAVPLVHAVRAFRFVAACRARGRGWTPGHPPGAGAIRVGHFTIDRIDADGGFRAGCHTFDWAGIARLALALGVPLDGGADVPDMVEA